MPFPANIDAICVNALDKSFIPLFLKESPFLDRISREPAGGLGLVFPVQTGSGGGRGGSFSASLTNAAVGGLTTAAFTPSRAIAYGQSIIDWESQPWTEDKEHAAIDMAVSATRNAGLGCTQDLAQKLLGFGYGIDAKCATATNTTGNEYDVQLTSVTDAAKFEEGDVLVSKTAPNASSLEAGTMKVTGVNQIAGIIHVLGDGTLVPTAGHYFGLQGNAIASSSVTGFAGIFAWAPPVASRTNGVVGDVFQGVTRTSASNVVFTSGWAYDATGLPVKSTVYGAAAQMSVYKNSRPTTLFCHPTQLTKLAKEFDSATRYDMKAATAGVEGGFAGFEITTAAGKVEVLAEPHMPADLLLLCDPKQIVLAAPKNRIMGPATNGKIIIDAYGANGEGNVSRASVMANGLFGVRNLAAVCVITVAPVIGVA